MSDEYFMNLALAEARAAEQNNEVPVGALLVSGSDVIAAGQNRMITNHDASAHAEIITLRLAGEKLKNYRLLDTTLYVTLEPCLMCCGALILARVGRVVFAATDPKTGALGSVIDVFSQYPANHRFVVTAGILAAESTALLQDFFRQRRGNK